MNLLLSFRQILKRCKKNIVFTSLVLVIIASPALATHPLTTQPAREMMAAGEFEEAYRLLWQIVKQDFNDVNANLLLARAAMKLQIHDQATAAYERILMVRPDHLRARLYLAIAFYRMNSYSLAENEFKKLVTPNTPTHFQDTAKKYLAHIEQKRKTHRWYGAVDIGRVYNTNVNTAPGSDIIDTIDGSRRLQTEDTRRSDWATIANFQITSDWDVGLRGGMVWRNRLTLKNYFYDHESDVNLNLVSLSSGPIYYQRKSFRLNIPITFDYLDYGSDPFYRTIGIKPSLDLFHTPEFMTRFFAIVQEQNYSTGNNRDGTYIYGGIMPRLFWSNRRFMIQNRFGYEHKWANDDTRAFQGIRSDTLLVIKTNKWLNNSFSFGYRNRWYDQRDVRYHNTREDERYKMGVRFTARMPYQLQMMLAYDYTSNKSSIDLHDYNQERFTIQLRMRF